MKHILVLPFPLSGHFIPMLNLCCKLSSRGITRITLLINQDCVESVKKLHEELVERGDFNRDVFFAVESIPFTWPAAFRGSADQIESLSRAIDDTGKFAKEVVMQALDKESSVLPVSFVLSDFGFWWSQDLANKLGVPRIVLSIIGFQEFGIILQMPWLISQKIYDPFNESTDDLDSKLIEMPGFPTLKASGLPRMSQFPEAMKCYWNALLHYMTRAREAKLILVNSCYELEGEAYDAILKLHKLPIHLAGPLLATPFAAASTAASSDCFRWLNTIKSPRSVLFSSFGTYLQLPTDELENILGGIEASGHHFLLAFRADLLTGEPSPWLLSFLDRYREAKPDEQSKQRGLIVPWAPQPEVLLHPSVGGFFTHFGWNSFLESIAGGVPMTGKPIMGDQLGNRRLAVDKWKVALEIPEDDQNSKKLTKEAVAATVRELLHNDELHANVARLRKSLEEVVQENGSACRCWDMIASVN